MTTNHNVSARSVKSNFLSVQLKTGECRQWLRVAALGLALAGGLSAPAADGDQTRRYHPDPTNVWNRLHESLFIRTGPNGAVYGHDELDALFWPNTSRHLLAAESHRRAVKVLREFVEGGGAATVTNRVARAVMQRDLWAAFDAMAGDKEAGLPPETESARRDLRRLLAAAILRIALRAEEIQALPDVYRAAVEAKPFPADFDPANPDAALLPPDLFDPDGPWVCVGEKSQFQGEPFTKLVPAHVDFLSRSVFLVFLRVPEGRAAALAYLDKLSSAPEPWKVGGRRVEPSPTLPEFPPGTQVALVRRAMLIDAQGRIVPTRLIESIQYRIYTPDKPRPYRRLEVRQGVAELVLSPKRLLAGETNALHAVGPADLRFGFFPVGALSDPFEEPGADRPDSNLGLGPALQSCHACHHQAGLRGFMTYVRDFGGRRTEPPILEVTTPAAREESAVYWKHTQPDWAWWRGLTER